MNQAYCPEIDMFFADRVEFKNPIDREDFDSPRIMFEDSLGECLGPQWSNPVEFSFNTPVEYQPYQPKLTVKRGVEHHRVQIEEHNPFRDDMGYYRTAADSLGSYQMNRTNSQRTPESEISATDNPDNLTVDSADVDVIGKFIENLSAKDFQNYEVFSRHPNATCQYSDLTFSVPQDDPLEKPTCPPMSKSSKQTRKGSHQAKSKPNVKGNVRDHVKAEKPWCLKNVLKSSFYKANRWIIQYMVDNSWENYASKHGVQLKDVRIFATILQKCVTMFNFSITSNLWSGKDINLKSLPKDILILLEERLGNLHAISEVYRAGLKAFFKRNAILCYQDPRIKKTTAEMISTVQSLHRGVDKRDFEDHHTVLITRELLSEAKYTNTKGKMGDAYGQ